MPSRHADLDHVGAYNFKVEISGASATGKDEHYYSIILENGSIAAPRTEQLSDSFEFSISAPEGGPPPTDPIIIADIPYGRPQPQDDVVPEDDGFGYADRGASSAPQPSDPIIIADIPEPLPQPVEGRALDGDGSRDEWIDVAG